MSAQPERIEPARPPGGAPPEPPAPAAAPADAAPAPLVGTAQFLQIFTAVMLPMFLAAVDQTLLATATPAISADLGDLRDATWIAVGYLIATTVTVPLYGRLGDRRGRRDMLLVALALFAVGSVACALAPGLWFLVGARVLQGVGGGGLMVLSQALIGELVPPRQRVRFQAYFATVFTAASVGGPVLGGIVVSHVSWRWLFWANLPLCAFAAWRLARLPRRAPVRATAGVPTAGAPAAEAARVPPMPEATSVVLFAAAVGTSLLWLTFGGHRFAWGSAAGIGAGLLALALWVALIGRERTRAAPFLPLELLRVPGVAPLSAVVVCFAASLFALVFFLPIWLQLGQRVDAGQAGWLMLPLTGGLVLGSTVTGRIVARTGRPTVMPPAGLLLSAAALVAMGAWLPAGRGVLLLGLVCGLGFGTVMPTAQVVMQTLAGPKRLGIAAATVSLARSTGGALGTALSGALVFALLHGVDLQALLRAHEASQADVAGAFRALFFSIAALCAGAAILALRLPAVRL